DSAERANDACGLFTCGSGQSVQDLLLCLNGGNGLADQVALHFPAAFLPQKPDMLFGLDTLRDDVEAKVAPETEDGADDFHGLRIVVHAVNERTINLDLVKRERQ